MSLSDFFSMLQAAAAIATPITILLTIRQLRLSRDQLKKQSDSVAVNFVLNAEGQFDGMHEQALNASASVIRLCYAPEINQNWNDDEVRTFVFMRRLFGHVSRMVYIIHDKTVDVGMDEADRVEFLRPWEAVLRKYAEHPIMLHVYSMARQHRNYNHHMLALCERVFAHTPKATPAQLPSEA